MTALNFPTSPADGDTFDNYIYDGVREVWRLQPNIPGISSRFKVSATAPENPANGEIWLNSTDGNTYIYYADVDSAQWIEIGGTSGFPPDLDSLNDVTITSPTTGQKLIYNGTNWVNVIDNINSLVDVNITSPVAGQKLVYDGNNWVNLEAYALVDTLYFTSSGTFTKADFPFLRAIRVKCQGGGGAGGGAIATGPDTISGGGGGGGGAYAESFITDVSGLPASVTVTRGAGGPAGPTTGSGGGQSFFANIVSANGGFGGDFMSVLVGPVDAFGNGGQGANIGVGDVVYGGSPGGNNFAQSVDRVYAGMGGGSFLGGGGRVIINGQGSPGNLFGGGGAGTGNSPNAGARNGGAGANGIVIIELFA